MNALTPYSRPEVVRQALALLECEVREADALVDARVLDHFIVTRGAVISMAERGLV